MLGWFAGSMIHGFFSGGHLTCCPVKPTASSGVDRRASYTKFFHMPHLFSHTIKYTDNLIINVHELCEFIKFLLTLFITLPDVSALVLSPFLSVVLFCPSTHSPAALPASLNPSDPWPCLQLPILLFPCLQRRLDLRENGLQLS